MTVYAYVRCSTREQADSGLGLDAQREAIKRAVTQREWTLTDTFVDAGASGKDLKRPALTEALGVLKPGDVLVAAKVDRFSRSLHDFTGLLLRGQREGWDLVALDSAADTTTPEGEALVNVLAIFAQFERRRNAQRTKDALAVLKRQGVRLGRPTSLTSQDRARVITLAREHGYAPTARLLNEYGPPPGSGGRQWWASTVRSVVKSA